MKAELRLLNLFRPHALWARGELSFSPGVALDLVSACRAQESDLAPVGLEVCDLKDGRLRPRLDLIADWSGASAKGWEAFRSGCLDASDRFLRALSNQGPPVVVSVTLLAREEWGR